MKKYTAFFVTFIITAIMLFVPFYAFADGDMESSEVPVAPAKVTGVASAGNDFSSITVKWNKIDNASGYDVAVYQSSKKDFVHYITASNTYKITNLTYDTTYTVKVRAYIKTESENIYGEYSQNAALSTKRAINAPSVSGYCSVQSKPVVTWSKVKGAGKYVILRSTSKNGNYTQIACVDSKKTSYTDKKEKVHKTYYYKVRSYKKINGKGYYSRFSSSVKIMAMKTVIVGDSILEAVKIYKAAPGASFVTKVGMGTYTFYNNNYFTVNKKKVAGIDKLISMKPDRVYMMFGMNEAHYKKNKDIIKYYQYAIEDLKDERPKCEIVILSVSPTTSKSGKTYPKKKRLASLNKDFKKLAKKNKCSYYDFTKPFKNKNGELKKAYNAGDGAHWNKSGCKEFIKQINKYSKESNKKMQ